MPRRKGEGRLRGTFDANPVHPLDMSPFFSLDRETLSNLPLRAAAKFVRGVYSYRRTAFLLRLSLRRSRIQIKIMHFVASVFHSNDFACNITYHLAFSKNLCYTVKKFSVKTGPC